MKRTYVSGNKFLLWIGLLLHLVYYMLIAMYLYNYFSYLGTPRYDYAYWIYAVIIAVPIVLNYLAEGILSVTRRISVFNIIKLVLVVALVPLWIFCGSAGGIVEFIIWNAVFLAAFIIGIISLFKTPAPENSAAVEREVYQNYMSDYETDKREL